MNNKKLIIIGAMLVIVCAAGLSIAKYYYTPKFKITHITKPTRVPVKAGAPTLSSRTKYYLETYYIRADKNERITKKEYTLPSRFISFTRSEMNSYVSNYMADMPLSEYLSGLIDYEIITFSPEKLVLRKTYATDWNDKEFYICDENGEVVVYYTDKKSVFDYTGIRTDSLSREDRYKVLMGYYVSDEEELYSLLESFSS